MRLRGGKTDMPTAKGAKKRNRVRRAVDSAIALLVRPFLLLVCLVPARLLPAAARLLAGIARRAAPRDRRLVAHNLEHVLGLAPGSARALALERSIFEHGFMCALETVRIAHQPGLLRLDGYEEFEALAERAARAGQGLLVASAHLGAWELIGLLANRATRGRFCALAKPNSNPAITSALEALRRRVGSSEVVWLGRFGVLRRIGRVLRQGGAVGMLVDQKPEQRRGPVVSLLGKPAEFVIGPAWLASYAKCAVVTVFVARQGPFHYRVLAEEIVAGGHEAIGEVELSQRLASAIERAVRAYPEQWSWNYHRWYFDAPNAAAAGDALPAAGSQLS